MNRERSLRAFAWYSIAFAIIHFSGETAFHMQYGQPVSALVVDYIAVSLLLAGAWLALSKGWGAGVLCGAWGFEFCLCYRSFFWRFEEIRAGTASEIERNSAYVLGVLLVLAVASFAYSVWLCRPLQGD
jgi:hypothetical protein